MFRVGKTFRAAAQPIAFEPCVLSSSSSGSWGPRSSSRRSSVSWSPVTRNWTTEAGLTDVSTQIVNFFSFFTIDSNVLTVAVFLIGAVCLIKNETPSRVVRIGRARA